MGQQTEQFRVTYFKPAPAGEERYRGRVTFAFRPDAMVPLKVKHDRQNDDGEWRTYDDAEITGASLVRASGFVQVSKAGQPYVRVTGLDIPWGLSCAIADACLAESDKLARAASVESELRPADDPDDVPF